MYGQFRPMSDGHQVTAVIKTYLSTYVNANYFNIQHACDGSFTQTYKYNHDV